MTHGFVGRVLKQEVDMIEPRGDVVDAFWVVIGQKRDYFHKIPARASSALG
jgi:hypothetical protein